MKPTTPTWLRLLALALSVIASASCSSEVSEEKGYVIKDSGYLGRSNSSLPDIAWLDNDRVLFIGHKPGETAIGDGNRTVPKYALYVWNTKTAQVHRHAWLSENSSMCFSRGWIVYGYHRDGSVYTSKGVFGDEREYKGIDKGAQQAGRREFSLISCRDYDPEPLKLYGVRLIPLIAPNEYLDFPNKQDKPLRYFPADGSAPVTVTIPPTGISAPAYSEYADAYVMYEVVWNVRPESTQKVWLLDRRGNVSEQTIPAGPWMVGSTGAMPSRRGLFMQSHAVDYVGPGAAGGYLVSGLQVKRVIAGYPASFAVSPDGCRVAISIDSRTSGRRDAPHIKMIDLCSKGE